MGDRTFRWSRTLCLPRLQGHHFRCKTHHTNRRLRKAGPMTSITKQTPGIGEIVSKWELVQCIQEALEDYEVICGDEISSETPGWVVLCQHVMADYWRLHSITEHPPKKLQVKPFKSHKEALGCMLDLVQYRRSLDGLKLTDEELLNFREATKYHDRKHD